MPSLTHTGLNEAAHPGEMRVNIGGDSGRDDYGLPPVDIEIPDDARELEHDVQAYHREQRAERRRELIRRLYAPLSRDGMVLPLLAGCLALTLLAGTLLTVFTAGQGAFGGGANGGLPGGGRSRLIGPARNGAASEPAGSLPHATVTVGGRPELLSDLAGTTALVLALVPPGCECVQSVRKLAAQSQQAGARPYLVGSRDVPVAGLAHQAGLARSNTVQDNADALPSSYRPGNLTAVVVRADGSVVKVVPNPGQGQAFQDALRLITATTPAP